MALNGIGGNGADAGSALERFQRLRDAAQKKLDGADRQAGLAELIQRKQQQLGAGGASPGAARSPAERIPSGPASPGRTAAAGIGASADAAGSAGGSARVPAAYGRTGAARKQDTAPRLGQYIDFRA